MLGKATKFVVEKLYTSEVISQKPHGGWKTNPLVPLGLIQSLKSRKILDHPLSLRIGDTSGPINNGLISMSCICLRSTIN